MLKRLPLLAILALVSCGSSSEELNIPTAVGVETRVAATGLDHPWELVWGPDNWIWYTERIGRIGRLNPETGEVQLIHTFSNVWQASESGLLGMALHPDFPTTPHLFAAYTYEDGAAKRERVVRLTYNGSALTDETILIDGIFAANIHDGCRLVIHDNHLFITTGDAGNQGLPQNKDAINGKVLRINLDGSIPSDNPMPENAVWSWGHRNPQGLVVAPNGILYASEHGPDRDDEVNIIEKGRNYGWPNVNGYCEGNEVAFCNANNVAEPIAAWTPTLAVCGLKYYNNDLIPQWKNSLIMATLKEQQLMILHLSPDGRSVDSQTKAFDNQFGRLRAVCIAPDGRVFFSSQDKVIEVKRSTAKRKTSLNDATSELKLSAVGKMLSINAPSEFANATLEIVDLAGRLVHTSNLAQSAVVIDLNRIANGLYSLRLKNVSTSITGSFSLE